MRLSQQDMDEKEPPQQERPQLRQVLMAPKRDAKRKQYRDFFEPFTAEESALAFTDRDAFMALSVKKGKEALARRMQSPPPLKPGEKQLHFQPDVGTPCVGITGSVGLTFGDCSGKMTYIFPKCDHEHIA